jgi:hypothetical protein
MTTLGWDVEADDMLRPQSTFGYKAGYSQVAYDFPNNHIENPVSFYQTFVPISTYADDRNLRTAQRYKLDPKLFMKG